MYVSNLNTDPSLNQILTLTLKAKSLEQPVIYNTGQNERLQMQPLKNVAPEFRFLFLPLSHTMHTHTAPCWSTNSPAFLQECK